VSDVAAITTDATSMSWMPPCIAFVTTALLTWGLAHLAERIGWVDDGSDAPERKPQARPVPAVGGVAIACGCALAVVSYRVSATAPFAWIDPAAGDGWRWGRLDARSAGIPLALLAAFAVGLCDDVRARGLAPVWKLVGQALAAACVAAAAASGGSSSLEIAVWFVATIAAQNALNTFDNADGAAGSVALLGFAGLALGASDARTARVVAASLCGFLPFNLWFRRAPISSSSRSGSVPIAYLGDAGAHVLGVLLLLHPQTRLALLLPLVDLVRVVFVRAKLGIAPWIGDRRHLSHRMQARGWSPTLVAFALCIIAAPIVVAGALENALGHNALAHTALTQDALMPAARARVMGAVLSLILFGAALAACPSREGGRAG
jgi:UDP-GlcNAc:undecaprenyl-phosphate GlcNAc-1-phosphate transferase